MLTANLFLTAAEEQVWSLRFGCAFPGTCAVNLCAVRPRETGPRLQNVKWRSGDMPELGHANVRARLIKGGEKLTVEKSGESLLWFFCLFLSGIVIYLHI